MEERENEKEGKKKEKDREKERQGSSREKRSSSGERKQMKEKDKDKDKERDRETEKHNNSHDSHHTNTPPRSKDNDLSTNSPGRRKEEKRGRGNSGLGSGLSGTRTPSGGRRSGTHTASSVTLLGETGLKTTSRGKLGDRSRSSSSGLCYPTSSTGGLLRKNREREREREKEREEELIGGEGLEDRLEVGQVLGRGLTGTVHLATDAKNQRFAVKIVDKDNLVSAFSGFEVTKEDLLKNLQKEIKIMGSLHHRNIVHLVDTFQIDDRYYICMELVEGKDLLSLVPQGGLQEHVAKDYFFQLCSAIAYCHSNNIIHGDLKPENILIRGTDQRIKLIDFGFSHIVTGDPLKIIGNTVLYSPPCDPEMSFAWDAWALGIILYAMLVCSLPFTENQLTNSNDLELAVPPQIPSETYEIFEGFLNPDSTQRTPVGEMIAVSKWLKSERAKAIPESFSHPVKRPPPSQIHERVNHTVQVVPLSAKETATKEPPPGLVRAERKPFNNPFRNFGKKKDKGEKKNKKKRKELKRVREIDGAPAGGEEIDGDIHSSPVEVPLNSTPPPPTVQTVKQKSLSGSFLKMQDKILRGLPSDDMGDLFKKTPRNSSQTKNLEGGTPSIKTRGFSNSPSLSSSVDRETKGGTVVGVFSSPPPLPESSFSLSVEQVDLLNEMDYICLASNLSSAEQTFHSELQGLLGYRNKLTNKEMKIFFEVVESLHTLHKSIGEILLKSRGLDALVAVTSIVESAEFEKQHRLYQQYHAQACRFFLQSSLSIMSKTTLISLISAPMRHISHYITLYTSFYCIGIDNFHETTFADQILRLKMIFSNV